MKNEKVTFIAGPCSVDENNIREIQEIAQIEVKNRKGKMQSAVAGTRIVGLKSRTELDASGRGMGMDYPAYRKNVEILMDGGTMRDFEVLPSAYIAEEISNSTGMIIATEVMNPIIQLPSYVGRIGKGKLLPWNPAVNQLGWHIETMADFARRHGWHVGLKNGKWVGEHMDIANRDEYPGQTTMEKAWIGLVRYVGNIDHDTVLIHRGVDVPAKGNFRNAPVHAIAKRVKKNTGVKLYFDPSHSYGPKMRDSIPEAVISAMKMKLHDDAYLYDGVLIETGTSSTDTDQHITIDELRDIVGEVARFRDLVPSEKATSPKKSDTTYQFAS